MVNTAKQSGTNTLKATSKNNSKNAEKTGGLIGNENANKVKKVSRTVPQNSLGTVTNKQKAMKLMEKLEIYIDIIIW